VRHVRTTAVWVLATLFAGCTAVPATTTSPVTARSPEATDAPATAAATAATNQALVAQADGFTLTVTPDRLELAPGETVTFTATFHNGTDTPIDVAGSTCSAGMTGLLHVALPQAPRGRDWSGIRQAFKDFVLTEGMGPGIVPALQPLVVNMSAGDCGVYAVSSELQPGATVSREMSWKAEIVPGVDALASTVPFEVSVGYDQQNGPPSQPPDGPMISWSPMFKQLMVKGQVHVIGGATALKGPGEIIDAVLADKGYAAWLAKRPASTWSAANLFLESSPTGEGILPKGPAWEVDLFRERNVPRHWAIAFVDPFDAKLLSVTYCNIPCDR